MQSESVVSTGRELIYSELDEQLGQQEHLMFVEWIIKAVPNRPIYIVVINSTNTEMHIANHTVIGQANDTWASTVDPEGERWWLACQSLE